MLTTNESVFVIITLFNLIPKNSFIFYLLIKKHWAIVC
jgi:hypothetical protein